MSTNTDFLLKLILERLNELIPNEDTSLLTSKEMARELGVGEGSLRKWRMEGRGPDYILVEGAIRYEATALNRYLDKQRVAS